MAERKQQKKRSNARDDRRVCLLEAARRVFARKGYHPATVDDITREAGVAKGTFYLYFSEKPAIFYQLMEQFFNLVTQVGLSVSRDVQTAEDYYARVETAARRLAELFSENRDLVRLAYRESMGLDEQLERSVRQFYRQLARVEADNIRLGMELGLVRVDIDPVVAAYAHIGMVERVLLQWQFDRQFPQVDDLVKQLVKLVYVGLRKQE